MTSFRLIDRSRPASDRLISAWEEPLKFLAVGEADDDDPTADDADDDDDDDVDDDDDDDETDEDLEDETDEDVKE